jgi:hypothetical protein
LQAVYGLSTAGNRFNLEAYRELLMLYSVAKEIITPESKAGEDGKRFDLPDRPEDSANSRPMTFMSTAIQPLSSSVAEGQQSHHPHDVEPLMASVIPPPSLRLGLDIDLDNLPAVDVKADSTNDSDAKSFVNFDADATAVLPAKDFAQPTPGNTATDADNLIDFDIFDVPEAPSEKPAPPKR